MTPDVQLNGDLPDIIGRTLGGLVLEHFYVEGQIVDQVNVAHLRFGPLWFRLYFEGDTVFWRASQAPANPENADMASGTVLNDLSRMGSVVGQTVRAVTLSGSPSGARAFIEFDNGRGLQFVHDAGAGATRLIS